MNMAGLHLNFLPEYEGVSVTLQPQYEDHWYLVSALNRELPSVTTCLGIVDKSEPLSGWTKKLMAGQVRKELLTLQTGAADPKLLELWAKRPALVIYAMLERAKALPEKLRDEAGNQGTEAHALIAQILEGENPSIPKHLAAAVQGALAFIANHKITPLAVEQSLWHPTHEYAGTADLIARDADGRLLVIDWKRSNALYIQYDMQVAAYAMAVEALTGEKPHMGYTVRLAKTTDEPVKYTPRPVEDIPKAGAGYLAAQILWRAVHYPDW